MLKYVITFFITAVVAALLGFVFLHGRVALIAKIGFGVSILALIASLMYDPAGKYSEI